MAEVRVKGLAASPGYAAGPVVVVPQVAARRVATGDPGREGAALTAAIATAASELAAVVGAAEGDAADILGFQVALLDDDALAEPAFAAIAGGQAADIAWRMALDAEIAGYEAADDEYFRARSADLMDIRDRVLAHLSGRSGTADIPPGGILAADDLPPSRFLAGDWTKGGAILLGSGSPSSHVAMLARSRGVPMIVGLGGGLAMLRGEVLVDARRGEAIVAPSPETRRDFEARIAAERQEDAFAATRVCEPAMTRDGTPIATLVNIADPDELSGLDPAMCDGVGLVRTEFLFRAGHHLPDEATQYAAYRRIAEWAGGKPVTIRTLDAGGDKPIPGLTIDGESNPFLGVRGIRLSLAKPEVFRMQLRALARAAMHGAIKVMLPMVTVPAELEAARAMLAEEVKALADAGIPAREPPLGIMVEVPAAALAIDLFDAAFFSIGSNDLTQYVTAAGRDIGAVAALAEPANPGVMRLVAAVARHGIATGREVSLCGDAGGDPALIPLLLRAGLRAVSMAPAMIGRAKVAIAAVDLAARTDEWGAGPTPDEADLQAGGHLSHSRRMGKAAASSGSAA